MAAKRKLEQHQLEEVYLAMAPLGPQFVTDKALRAELLRRFHITISRAQLSDRLNAWNVRATVEAALQEKAMRFAAEVVAGVEVEKLSPQIASLNRAEELLVKGLGLMAKVIDGMAEGEAAAIDPKLFNAVATQMVAVMLAASKVRTDMIPVSAGKAEEGEVPAGGNGNVLNFTKMAEALGKASK